MSIWILAISACFSHAQGRTEGKTDTLYQTDYTVRIVGQAAGAEGRQIVWKADADDFSGCSEELARTRIDDSGRFVLATDAVSSVRFTYLMIDYYSCGLFVSPGKTYRMRFAPFDYHVDEKINAFVPSNLLPDLSYVLLDHDDRPDTTELNFLIGRYSSQYHRMMARNFEKITMQGDTAAVSDFIRRTDSLYASVEDPFFQDYRFYTEGRLYMMAGMRSRKELYRTYIENRPLVTRNPAQVDFLKTYYTEYFQTNRFLPFDQIRRILNTNSYTPEKRKEALSDSMGIDYSLRNELLREWVLIHALLEVAGNERINAGNIVRLLQYMQENSKFAPHVKAIGNFLKQRREGIDRRYFTGIELTDTAQRSVKIDSLLEPGMFHYFVLVRSKYENCQTCGEEMNRLKGIWNLFGPEVKKAVKVVVINCDYTFAQYFHDAVSQHYPWPYLHFNGNIEWVRKIDGARFPSYFLIDDKGHVLNSEFNAPSQNIEDVFRRMATLKSLQDRRNTGL